MSASVYDAPGPAGPAAGGEDGRQPAQVGGSRYREILQSSGIYSLAVIAQRISSVLLLPLYTHYLTPGEYGTSELLDLTISLFGILAGANLASGIPYFYFQSEDEDYRKRLRWTALLGAILVGSVGCLIGLTGAPLISRLVFQDTQHAGLFRIVFLSFGCSLPFEAGLAWFRVIDQPQAFVTASIGKLGLSIIFNSCFLVIGKMGIAGVLWGNLGAVAICATVLLGYSFRGARPIFDRGLFWRIVKFAAPVGIVWFSTFTINFGDRYFLERNVSLAQVGIYSLAYKAVMLLSAVQTPFSAYWNAQVFKLLKQDDAHEVYCKVFTYYMFVMTSAAVAIILFSGAALTLAASPVYGPAYILIPPLVAAYLIRAANDYFRTLLYTTNKVRMDAKIYAIAAAVALIAYTMLIPRYHLWGAVGATVLAFITVALLGYREAMIAWPFELEGIRLFKLFATGGAIAGLFLSFRPAGVAAQMALAILLTFSFGATILAIGFFTAKEKETIWRELSALCKGQFSNFRN